MQLRELSGQAGRALRLSRRRLAQVDLDRLPVPDTRAAKDAEEICRALPAHIANHSHRTYLWGAVLAAHDGIEYDPELLYVACLLHDAGLPAAVEAGDERCFTVRSSELASERSAAAGWSPARQDALAESITLHLNPSVGVDLGPEAHLVNAGAALDIVGMRRGQIGRDTARAVVQPIRGRRSRRSSSRRCARTPPPRRGPAGTR